jgi:hypothetical protein
MTNEDWDANMDDPEDQVGEPIEDDDDGFEDPEPKDAEDRDTDPAPED